ncbi:MAG: FecR domain-containing protein [Prolixibacteraceae bacterium]
MEKLDPLFENSELIAKKVTGELTGEESDRFDRWLNSTEQNQAFFKKIKDKTNFLIRNEQFESVNTTRAWAEFTKAISTERDKKRFAIFIRYAAVILLPLLIGVTVYWSIYGYRSQNHLQTSEIFPGTRSAFLVLSSGQRIDLGKEGVKVMKEADGTIIERSNDELHYKKEPGHAPEEILQDELVVPRGGEYSLMLSDGTKVYLNSMSRLIFPVRFSGSQRKVILEGEGYFEVQKDEEHPFIVETNGMQINVLGTSFNVKAYQDESQVYTTLVEGKVRINPGDRPNDELILEPDQQAVFNKRDASVMVTDVDAIQYMQWTTGRYIFADQPLDEIMKTLSRWYDFTYRYSDESIKTLRFEGRLNKYESVYPILDIIAKTGKVKVAIKGKEVLFTN